MSLYPVKILVVLTTLITVGTSIANTKVGWEYTYDVKNRGTRSEYVVGLLKFNGRDLAPVWGDVITAIGEFQFVGKLAWADTAPKWVPMRPYEGTYVPTFQEHIVVELLSGSNSAFRKVDLKSDRANQSRTGYIDGSYERPPNEAGPNWFYSITRGCWVNPARMDEAEKSISRH
jgi:hypothetical protein